MVKRNRMLMRDQKIAEWMERERSRKRDERE